jgi:Flp pilus assembly pilin Flp
MKKFMNNMVKKVAGWRHGLEAKVAYRMEGVVFRLMRPLQNQQGASIVEILGYALLCVLAIVVVWGLIKGWLPSFWQSITGRLDNLS